MCNIQKALDQKGVKGLVVGGGWDTMAHMSFDYVCGLV